MRYSRSIDAEIHSDRQSKDALRTWLNLARKCADFNLLPSMTQPDFVLSRFMRNTRRQARSTSLITLSKISRFVSVKFGPMIGLFKAEVIHRLGPWKSADAVEWETLKWVDWFNNRRLLEPIGYITPTEAEEAFYANMNILDKVA